MSIVEKITGVSTKALATIAILGGVFVSTMTVAADARPSTKSFTCEGVQDFVDDRGSVVMNTKNSSVYRRFVADRTYCVLRESTRRFSVPTKDGLCRLKICYEYENFRSR